MSFNEEMARFGMERKLEWRKWCLKIPALEFPPGWRIKIIPPFAGAMVRFTVSTNKTRLDVSVYLDCYDALGVVGEPYWEVYPVDGDTERFLMAETEELIKSISKALKVLEGEGNEN